MKTFPKYKVGNRIHHSSEKSLSWKYVILQLLILLVIAWSGMLLYYWQGSRSTSGGSEILASNTTLKDNIYLKPTLPDNIPAHVVSPNLVQSLPATPSGRKKIAYAITVTKDGLFLDGALVLGYGIMKLHHENGKTNNIYWDSKQLDKIPLNTYVDQRVPTMSKYGADLIAFVTPNIIHAKHILGNSMSHYDYL